MAKAKKKPASKKAAKKSPAKKTAKPAAKKKPAPKKAAKPAPKKAAKPAPKQAAKPAAKKPAAKAAAKPAPKKAAAKPAKAPKATSHEPSERAKAAIAGDLAVLGKLVSGAADTYRWFAVASDFGHADADERLAELREELDEAGKLGETHFELGVGYLTGSDGLPTDHDKARSQLASAKEHGFGDDASALQRARGRLDGDALAVFDAVYDISSSEGAVDTAWGNEHTHNDPKATAAFDTAADDGDHADDSHDDE